jgi:hypothetical protein
MSTHVAVIDPTLPMKVTVCVDKLDIVPHKLFILLESLVAYSTTMSFYRKTVWVIHKNLQRTSAQIIHPICVVCPTYPHANSTTLIYTQYEGGLYEGRAKKV